MSDHNNPAWLASLEDPHTRQIVSFNIEPIEMFQLLLSGLSGGAVISDSTGTATIIDDDGYRLYLPVINR